MEFESDETLVVDTNVAIVANGKSDHSSIGCQIACIEVLEKCRDLKLALDSNGLVMVEYSRHLSYAGQPGVGDMFFKYLHDNQHAGSNISLHKITPVLDESRGFDELPVNQFDPSDRKILATAVVAGASVVNATDSDWEESRELLDELNVIVCQLCPEHCAKGAR